jgi:hypothetical protein
MNNAERCGGMTLARRLYVPFVMKVELAEGI